MKKLITHVLLLYCSSVMIAQTIIEDDYIANAKKTSKQRVFAAISIGSSMSFLNSEKSPVYTTFVGPQIGYQLTSKFKVNVGLTHYTASVNTLMELNAKKSDFDGNKLVSGNFIFFGGDYQLTKKLIVSGSVMANANDLSTKQNNFKVATLGFDYKVSERSSIGFRAVVSGGDSDYLINSRLRNYDYNLNNMNSAGSFFLSPLTQWGVDKTLNPMIR